MCVVDVCGVGIGHVTDGTGGDGSYRIDGLCGFRRSVIKVDDVRVIRVDPGVLVGYVGIGRVKLFSGEGWLRINAAILYIIGQVFRRPQRVAVLRIHQVSIRKTQDLGTVPVGICLFRAFGGCGCRNERVSLR